MKYKKKKKEKKERKKERKRKKHYRNKIALIISMKLKNQDILCLEIDMTRFHQQKTNKFHLVKVGKKGRGWTIFTESRWL